MGLTTPVVIVVVARTLHPNDIFEDVQSEIQLSGRIHRSTILGVDTGFHDRPLLLLFPYWQLLHLAPRFHHRFGKGGSLGSDWRETTDRLWNTASSTATTS